MDQQISGLHNWHTLSKMKLKDYKAFFQILILLSGDVALNHGPTQYPCSFCGNGVGAGSVNCTLCNKWIHSKCKGLTRSQVIALSRTADLNFTCRVCRDSQNPASLPPAHLTSLASPVSPDSLGSPISMATQPISLGSPPTSVPDRIDTTVLNSTHPSIPSPAPPTSPGSPVSPESHASPVSLATQMPLESDPLPISLDSSATSLPDRSDIAVLDGAHPTIPSPEAESDALPFAETSLPADGMENLLISDEHLQNISLNDESEIFKRKGLHFVHLNCNSLLNKIDEIRQFVTDFKPHVICFSETKIDSSVSNSEVSIDGYSVIRRDRNRHGGGVACFVNNSIHFNERNDFVGDFEHIFIDILLPKTTPILLGVVYRPPNTLNFDELLSNSILNASSFDNQEVYILGDTNYNLIDRKNKFILKKGYRWSSDDSNYSTPLYLTKKYVEMIRTFGLTQLIEEPTRTALFLTIFW